MPATRHQMLGMTLLELVIALSVSVIVVSFMALFINAPVQSYFGASRRAELVAEADLALRRVARDVQQALPNSVRVTSGGSIAAVELLSVLDAARYADSGDAADPNGWLDLTQADTAFRTVGAFIDIVRPWSSSSAYLSIYNVGVPGADAYELANVITPAGTTISIAAAAGGRDQVTLSGGFRFAFASPRTRVFLVEGPVTYLCDTAAGTLTRYSGYAIAAAQTARDSAAELLGAGATAGLLANDVVACTFQYTPGALARAGLLSARIEIGRQGERVVLLQQAHVVNAP